MLEDAGACAVWRLPGSVVVLVGSAGSGKTTVRNRLALEGLSPDLVVSLDDLRRTIRSASTAAGRPERELQTYGAAAARSAQARARRLAALGHGYLADATNLRRSERRAHTRLAREHGLPAYAIVLPAVSLDDLLARDAGRPADERVPPYVLAAHAHRRSLLDVPALREEGFADVAVLDDARTDALPILRPS